jgi:hypothetical protein
LSQVCPLNEKSLPFKDYHFGKENFGTVSCICRQLSQLTRLTDRSICFPIDRGSPTSGENQQKDKFSRPPAAAIKL